MMSRQAVIHPLVCYTSEFCHISFSVRSVYLSKCVPAQLDSCQRNHSATPNDRHPQGYQSIIPLSDMNTCMNVQIVQIVVAVGCCVSQWCTIHFILCCTHHSGHLSINWLGDRCQSREQICCSLVFTELVQAVDMWPWMVSEYSSALRSALIYYILAVPDIPPNLYIYIL